LLNFIKNNEKTEQNFSQDLGFEVLPSRSRQGAPRLENLAFFGAPWLLSCIWIIWLSSSYWINVTQVESKI